MPRVFHHLGLDKTTPLRQPFLPYYFLKIVLLILVGVQWEPFYNEKPRPEGLNWLFLQYV